MDRKRWVQGCLKGRASPVEWARSNCLLGIGNGKVMGILIDSTLRRQLAIPATYGHLLFNCLSLLEDTARDVERHWGLSASEIEALHIRSCPSETGNLIAAHSCLERFGDVISTVPGFYFYSRNSALCNCHEWRSGCVCHLEAARLDLNANLSRRGLILPSRNPRGWLTELWVYRNVFDQRPFLLGARRREEIAA